MFHNHLGPLLAAGSVAAIACAMPAAAQVGDEQVYSLPAQDLATSLREVAARSGRNIIAPSELVAGRQAPAVSGPFTAEGVVRLLLTGSGLEVRRVGESLVIARSTAAVDAPWTGTPGDAPGEDNETIVVTGTNIRGGQPTSPLIVLDRDQIDESGAASVEQLMRSVPQNFQGGINQENFRVAGAGADVTEHGAGLNLRGLGQRATLVLVNGRRIAPSGAGSFVDVSLIPLSAVERVEILTDGASAIYGSDAVGGVVNFIMRSDFEGVETLLHGGTATEGDGDQLVAGVTGGTRWGGGSAMLSYEYRHDDEIRARDRSYTVDLPPDTSIFPRERRHSLFGLLNQEIAAGMELDLAGSLSRRDTTRTYFFAGLPLPVAAEAEARTASLTGTLGYRFGGDWLAQVTAGWSRSATEQMQSQPGGQGLVNRFDSRNEIFDLGVKVDGSLVALPGGDVRVAFGAQARRESYFDFFETGVLSRETRADRDVRSLFGELHVPIFSRLNRLPGLERLTFTAAARYEHYDRFGGSLDPEVGLLWSPVSGLSLRASYGTSFRAPLLSESIGLYNVFYFPAFVLTAAGPPASGIALATGGTNPDVGPEQSESWTAGLDFEPRFAPGLRLRVNYYDIHFSERIALPAPSLIVIGNPAFDPIIDRSPSPDRVRELIAGAGNVFDFTGPGFTPGNARPEDVTLIIDNRFGNTAVTTTDGVDVGVSYAFEAGENRFLADVNANYIFSFEDRLTPTAPVISGLNRPLRPVDLRARGGLGWTRGPWGANLFVNYTDGYRDDRRPEVRPVESWTTFDLGLSYSAGADDGGRSRPLRVAVHVQNLFDEDPPRLLPDPTVTTGLGYDPVNATGRGRTISLQLRIGW